MVAIIGESGSGKSTIFNAILNQLQIESGEILIAGKSLKSYSKREWKKLLKLIGFLGQDPNLIDIENVYVNLKRSYTRYKNAFYEWFGILNQNQRNEIYETLNSLNIFDKTFSRVSDLSGGQKKRVELAKLFLKDASLILADEPTSNLDRKNAMEILNILKRLNQEKQVTILVNIHDLSLLKNNFSKFIAIKNGGVIASGSLDKISIAELESYYYESTQLEQ
ncbi:ABC-type phosphate/phosphonate transport system, ATP-binding protein [Metamycoplasma arthritidis 158L3-1]|uniref:ABC-type phosphate/phosphonate transport system, ATP-binding protein n=2 Tax=Metamycoplasma arthritidis TaxID=2111 RepID=B3PLZ9_META1|nr:ABC-type phosphate/phosphonate transport system, ATP-binding protein [Metamycoplasma arthritidis 158L3-1]